MAIIISKDGKNAKRVDKATNIKEGFLQKYIRDNPECIPLYDFKEDVQLLILSREFPTESGPLDAIGMDEDGEIYLIETKLFKNPDKRTVVAQVLDYGASLWRNYSPEDFINVLEERVAKDFHVSLKQKIMEFYKLEEEEASELITSLKEKAEDGLFRFVVLMDRLEERLKDLILFLNANSQFDIFAAEVEYYRHEDLEILIPKLFGAGARKPGSSERKKWDKNAFFEIATQKLGQTRDLRTVQSLYEFSEKQGKVDWGTGGESGSFTLKVRHPKFPKGLVSLLTVWTDGEITFRFGNMRKRVGQEEVERFCEKLFGLPFAESWNKKENLMGYGSKYSCGEAFPTQEALDTFKLQVSKYLQEIEK
jgi:hypothetical protein